jgi:transcriptional regulator with XRE-family HTH domain
MDALKKNIGRRLKEIRLFVFDGMTINVFAEMLSEKPANISNYEQGKANIPNRVLVELYHKGINPIYILTGEGAKKRENFTESISGEATLNRSKLDYLIEKADEMTVAAGDIRKYVLEQQSKSDADTNNK